MCLQKNLVRVLLYYIGKPRNSQANAMAEEYIKRSGRYAKCEMREIRLDKNGPDRFDPFLKHPDATKVLLDPAGKSIDTLGFVALVKKAEEDARDLVFVIGGSDGLPPEWKPRANALLALSPLTMPHELARVVLAEQIYRAFTWLRGHPYPR